MNTPTTRLSKQPLLLEPDQAEQLDALAKKLKVPKQVLLREAVSEMLAMRGYGTTPLLQNTRSALELALPVTQRLLSVTPPGQRLWPDKALKAHHAIRTALALFPDVKKGLL